MDPISLREQDFLGTLFKRNQTIKHCFPAGITPGAFLDQLFSFLFSGYGGHFKEIGELETEYLRLKQQFLDLASCTCNNQENIKYMADAFFLRIPEIYESLALDAEAIFNFDPAAHSVNEVFLAYPGFFATAVYRLSNRLLKMGLPALPRIFAEYAHSKTGIDIHPGASIGENFVIDHGTGVVIGETAEIGKNVTIYQGVTLGALHVSKAGASQKRHPTIEDNVVIYSGATILGGETIVGHNSIIGGNVWLTASVEPWSLVYHKESVLIKTHNPSPEPLNFVI